MFTFTEIILNYFTEIILNYFTEIILNYFTGIILPVNYNTVKPYMSHTSKELIKCHLDNFSMGFILLYVNLSIFEYT